MGKPERYLTLGLPGGSGVERAICQADQCFCAVKHCGQFRDLDTHKYIAGPVDSLSCAEHHISELVIAVNPLDGGVERGRQNAFPGFATRHTSYIVKGNFKAPAVLLNLPDMPTG